MFNRRRIPLVVAVLCVLVLASSAAAAPNTFSAALTPTHVKPMTSAAYTLTITNGPTSAEADRAKVAIPAGFTGVGDVTANASAALSCAASAWEADGTLIANGKINLRRPMGGGNRNLCPGATLTVSFSALSPSTPGSYTWTPELIRDEEAEPFTFTGDPTVHVDGTAPTVEIAAHPNDPSNSNSASFAFIVGEPIGPQCKLDDAAFAPCSSPVSYVSLSDGTHTFTVQATDSAGNTGQASFVWTIDTTAPETTITSGPPAHTNETSASFAFTSEAGSTFECSLDAVDAGNFVPCTSPTSYTGLPGGTRTFRVRAKDAAGNTDASPASHAWTIDLVGAATTILTAPPSSTNSTSASFTFASSEPGTTFECSLDGALFTACSSPVGYNNLSDGQHTFSVRAVDPAENTAPEASHTWTIDTRPPTATVASGPRALSNSGSATFAFSADEPSSFQCSLDGGSFLPCSSPATYAGLGDGAHTFVARPTDAVGNPGASASYGWTIDATAPQTTLASGPASRTTAVSATFRFSASESAVFECKLDAAAFAPCSSPKTYARLRRSGHSFSVRAIDAAGNPDPTPAVRRWTIAAISRKVTVASPLFAPRAGGRVTSPPLLRWRPVARASYYNVQLYRGRVKVLSSWPTRTRLQVRARWTYLGRQRRLAAGTYRWYVWPGYGRPSALRYGRLLGQSTFIVTARR
ncbi:MAG TPA: Ig-like domain-containing protein [Gaiellaceae bacterium]